jgi:hypothetical protein
MAAISGHGTALTHGTNTTFTPKQISVAGIGGSRPSIETGYLGIAPSGNDASVWMPKILGDFVTGRPIAVEAFFEPENGIPPILEDLETITITYPDSGAATYAFSGGITDIDIGEAVSNAAMRMNYQIDICGTPTFTA